jgi:hypothetical protein
MQTHAIASFLGFDCVILIYKVDETKATRAASSFVNDEVNSLEFTKS